MIGEEEKIALLIDELEDIRCDNFDADTDEDKALKEAIRLIKASKQNPCDNGCCQYRQKFYQVFHEYDVDGGFGDAIPNEDLIATFATVEEAEAFVKKYAKPHVYDVPYASLYCGTLNIRKVSFGVRVTEEEMWWLTEGIED